MAKISDKDLSEEVMKLQKMLQVETFSRMKDSNTDNGELCMPGGGEVSGEVGKSSKRRNTNKRKRHSGSETGDVDMPSSSYEDNEIPRESAKDLHKEVVHRGSLVVSHKVFLITSIYANILSRYFLSSLALTNVNFQPQCCGNFEGSGMCLELKIMLFYLFIWYRMF